VAVAVGGYPAYQLYITRQVNPIKLIEKHRFLGKVHIFLRKRCYIDTVYHKVADGTNAFSNILYKRLECSIDALNYDVASFFRRLSRVMYKYPELRGIDALNYFLAHLVTSFARRFRKTHTGVLSYNMLTAFVGVIILIVLLLLFGGVIP